jgi:hypothetical protein
MASSTELTSFETVFPRGVQLSDATVSILEQKGKGKQALAFDEITLEGKDNQI